MRKGTTRKRKRKPQSETCTTSVTPPPSARAHRSSSGRKSQVCDNVFICCTCYYYVNFFVCDVVLICCDHINLLCVHVHQFATEERDIHDSRCPDIFYSGPSLKLMCEDTRTWWEANGFWEENTGVCQVSIVLICYACRYYINLLCTCDTTLISCSHIDLLCVCVCGDPTQNPARKLRDQRDGRYMSKPTRSVCTNTCAGYRPPSTHSLISQPPPLHQPRTHALNTHAYHPPTHSHTKG